jgi:hypothetical protein
MKIPATGAGENLPVVESVSWITLQDKTHLGLTQLGRLACPLSRPKLKLEVIMKVERCARAGASHPSQLAIWKLAAFGCLATCSFGVRHLASFGQPNLVRRRIRQIGFMTHYS